MFWIYNEFTRFQLAKTKRVRRFFIMSSCLTSVSDASVFSTFTSAKVQHFSDNASISPKFIFVSANYNYFCLGHVSVLLSSMFTYRIYAVHLLLQISAGHSRCTQNEKERNRNRAIFCSNAKKVILLHIICERQSKVLLLSLFSNQYTNITESEHSEHSE